MTTKTLAQRTPVNSPFAVLYETRPSAPVAPKRERKPLENREFMALDRQGRAIVNMAPKRAQAISISKTGMADAARNDSIKRGGI